MDQLEFDRIRAVSTELIAAHGERNKMFDGIQRIFEMEWDQPPDQAHIRELVSPGGHNVIRGLVNMLTDVEPRFNVPCSGGTVEDEERRDKAEKTLRALYRQVDDLRNKSLASEMALSGALFDLIAAKMVRTKDHADILQKHADKKGEKGDRKRLDRQIRHYAELAKTHPFLVDVLAPSTCFAKFGPLGLDYVVEARQRPVHSLRHEFGDTACPGRTLTEYLWYYEYWDQYQYCKWTNESEQPFMLDEYDYPSFIPYVIHHVNGTEMFGNVSLFPILYPLWKGDVWHAENTALTMWRSNLVAMGNPTFVAIGPSAHQAEIPHHLAGARINLQSGDSISQLPMNIVPAELMAFHNAVRVLEEESTINKMVFGKAPENVLAYSTVNLLVQGARHNIVALLYAMGRVVTDMSRRMLKWTKESGDALDLYGREVRIKLEPNDIDEQMLMVEAEYKPDIPQDRLQLANMAKMLVDSGIMSKHTARSLSGSDQPNEEEELIVRENIRTMLTQFKLKELEAQYGSQPGMPQEAQAAGPQQPDLSGFIPPPVEPEITTSKPGFIGQETNVPVVQAMGAPPLDFQQAAADNMGQVETPLEG